MAPEPRTIRAFFERQLAELRESIPSALAAAIVSDDACLTPDVGASALSPQAEQVRSLVAAARAASRSLGLDQARCLIVDGTAGVLIVRPIATGRPRLIVLLLADPRDVTRALAGAHHLAAQVEARLAPANPA